MIKGLRSTLLLRLIPEEKTFEEARSKDKEQTRNDQLIILGWNMYRQELIEKLKL